MPNPEITIALSHEEAEVLLGVLTAERHNAEAEAVCEEIRRRLDEALSEGSAAEGAS